MARSAVLIGRTNADLIRMGLTLVTLSGIGLLLGWRVHGSALRVLAGFLVLLLFGYAFSWIGVLIGLSSPTTEAAGTAGLVWMFPVVLVSGAFMPPTRRMSGMLLTVAQWNPVTATAVAGRELFGNPNPVAEGSLPLEYPVAASVLWSLLLLTAAMALSKRAWRRRTR